jgi:hypothetical protein
MSYSLNYKNSLYWKKYIANQGFQGCSLVGLARGGNLTI